MLFNSLEFLIFLPITFVLYWHISQRNVDWQNTLTLLASYFFYGWWDYRFLALILLSTVVDYSISSFLNDEQDKSKRKKLLAISLFVNLGALVYFKYCNFFIDSFVDAFGFLGINLDSPTLNIILPVGISFYTFQTLSYTIDVYRRQMQPTRNFIAFATYVSFFPQLVAGPIERAKDLLPQFKQLRKFDHALATDGMRQILLGLFKKIVIADGCALHVNFIFSNYSELSGATLLVGGLLFIMQIYCDFSGYSDIAIGTAKLFGVNLTKNFDSPYLSTSTTEIWRRWHITLGNWANAYVFKPIAIFSVTKFGNTGMALPIVLTFLLIGLWHGANYTFILFGLIHGLVLSIEFFSKNQRRTLQKKINIRAFRFSGWSITMTIWLLTCILFRSPTVSDAAMYIRQMFTPSLFSMPSVKPFTLIVMICGFLLFERFQRTKEHAMDIACWPQYSRWLVYLFMVWLIVAYGTFTKNSFIYFQF